MADATLRKARLELPRTGGRSVLEVSVPGDIGGREPDRENGAVIG